MRRGVRLMISVTGPAEAALALAGGADLLDVKDPRSGALGAASPDAWRAVVAARDAGGRAGAPRVEVSVAIGDASGGPGPFARAAADAAAARVDYVKVGLFAVGGEADATAFLRAIVAAARGVSPAPRVIAAAYADGGDGRALPLASLAEVARRAGADGCLVDTFRKEGGGLFDHVDAAEIRALVDACRRRALSCGLAGSLGAGDLPAVVALAPDLIGVRGAVCAARRAGRLDPDRLAAFRRAFAAAARAPLAPAGRAAAPRTPRSAPAR